jgi:glutaredoxin
VPVGFFNLKTRRVRRSLVVLWLALLGSWAAAQEVAVHIFWQAGCPYCSQATAAITEMVEADPKLSIERIELGVSVESDQLFRSAVAELGIERPAVPLVVVGSQYQLGFAAGRSEAVYRSMIEAWIVKEAAKGQPNQKIGALKPKANQSGFLPLM